MTDIGDLLAVTIDARINKLEKAMKKATDITAGNFDRIERRAKQSSQRLESEMSKVGSSVDRINASLARFGGGAFSALSRSALLAAAPILSLGAAIAGTKAALDKFGEINDRSTRARLDPEFFQGIAYQAKLAGVEIDGISTAAENFAKASAQATENRGKLFTQLLAEHAPLVRSLQLATSQEQRWRLIADAIHDAKNADDALVIATAAFGDQGGKLVDVFRGGGAEIDKTVAKAKELGLVVDRDVIARADELGDQFDTVSTIIDQQLKTALVNLGPVIVGLTGQVANWTKDLNIVLDQFKQIEDRAAINPLQNNLVSIENQRATLLQDISGLQEQLKTLDPASGIAGTITGQINEKAARAEELMKQALDYQERIAQLQGKAKDNLSASPVQQTPVSPVLVRERPLGGNSREGARHEAGDLFDGTTIDKVASSLDHVTKAAHDSTIALASTDHAVDSLSKRFDDFENMTQGLVGDLISGAEAGHGAIETLASAFSNLGDQLLRMAANQAIKSIFAALMGSPITAGAGIAGGALGFAGGGYTGAGGRHEPAGVVHRGEVVWSQDDVARHGGPAVVDAMRRLPGFADGGVVGGIAPVAGGGNTSIGGRSISISAPVTVNGSAGTPAQNADLARQTAKALEGAIRGVMADEMRKQSRPGNLLNSRS